MLTGREIVDESIEDCSKEMSELNPIWACESTSASKAADGSTSPPALEPPQA
jgi:hypothetical protein